MNLRRVLRWSGYALSAGVVGWLVLVVLPALGDLDEAGELLLTHLRATDAMVALALLAAYLYTHARTVTAALPQVPLTTAVRLRTIAGGLSRIVPAGWAAGTGVLVSVLRGAGVRKTAIAHVTAVTGVWNTVTKLLLPVVGVVGMTLFGIAPGARGWQVGAAAALGLAALAGGLVLLGRPEVARALTRAVQRPVQAVAGRTGREVPDDLPERAVELQRSTRQALRRRPLPMAAWYGAHHLTQAGLVYLGMRIAARGAGLEVGWPEVLTAFALGYLLTGLPISPGGLGTLDVAVVAVLTALGEQPAVVSAGLGVYRVTTYGLYMVALATWPLWRPSGTRLRDAAAQQGDPAPHRGRGG